MLEDHTYTTWTAQSDTSTPPISTRGTGRRWRTIAVHSVRPSKKEPQKLKPKQLMPKSNDNAAMNMRSRLQIEQISSQSSHADTAEENWRLVLASYPMKELVRENVERFAMLMLYSKPRRPPKRLVLLSLWTQHSTLVTLTLVIISSPDWTRLLVFFIRMTHFQPLHVLNYRWCIYIRINDHGVCMHS